MIPEVVFLLLDIFILLLEIKFMNLRGVSSLGYDGMEFMDDMGLITYL